MFTCSFDSNSHLSTDIQVFDERQSNKQNVIVEILERKNLNKSEMVDMKILCVKVFQTNTGKYQ